MKNIYVTLTILIAFTPPLISSAKGKKKLLKTTSESTETTTAQPAIIAIEIVDPNENKTTTKNSKRTIDSALGYGYNSYNTAKPRYEVYEYSQHDIPPYKGNPANAFRSTPVAQVNIQKSIQYSLPPITEHSKNILRPGTTLYSSLNGKGQVGGLTTSLSQISDLQHQQVPVPVIVLRIYPDQLQHSTIQANLPESHPFSKTINSINIQALLLQYLKALQNPSLANSYSGTQHGQISVARTPSHSYISHNVYSAPTQPPVQETIDEYSYQAPKYYTQNTYQKPEEYKINNGETVSYQNYQQVYPQEVNYQHNKYQQPQYTNYRKGVQVQEAPVKYQFSYQSPAVQEESSKAPEPAPQYYYVQPNPSINYERETAQYYHPSQNTKYKEQIHHTLPQGKEYYPTDELAYSASYRGTQKGTYGSKTPSLLTTENYPSNKHTKVIFRTETGDVRTPEQEDSPAKEVKTIKIHVPDNIAKVEVQESQKPYYGFQPTYDEGQQNSDGYNQEQGYSNAVDPSNYYSSQDAQQGGYYGRDEQDTNDSYGYQNINYEQMVKYFSRRGTKPSYFYSSTEDNETDDQGRLPTENLAKAYEEAAFPSSSQSPEKKKVKSKKRT